MLINLSNHPSPKWGSKQKNTAQSLYGNIIDVEFPAIDPLATTADVKTIADAFFLKVTEMLNPHSGRNKPNAVHVQGEFTFVYHIVSLLKASGIVCLASTSKRIVKENAEGEKVVSFRFVSFREY
jgi:hypothetical protein